MGTGAAIGAVLGLSAGGAVAQAQAPGPVMKAVIKPGVLTEADGGKGDVNVTLSVPGMDIAAGEPIASLWTMVPSAAKPQAVSDVKVTDASGAVPVTGRMDGGGMKWRSTRAVKGDVTISYRLSLDNTPPLAGGPPIGLRIDGDGFSGAGDRVVMTPGDNKPYVTRIVWDLSAMGPGAKGVSSHGDGDLDVPFGPVGDRMNRTWLMAGHMDSETLGAFSAVWTGKPAFDPHPAMQWTAKLHKAMSVFFKDKTEPPYRVFLRFNPMNAGGGAAMTHSFIVTYGAGVTGDSIKSILGHEMTHTWTSTGIGKWYDEGNAVYYQALLPWRAGLMSTDEFLQDLNETASRYYTNAMRSTPEAEVVPKFWEDTRIRVLPYDRGALYFAVLNGKVKKASGGKRSIDDLIQTMIEKARQGQPTTEEVWLDLLKKEIGADGAKVHQSMLAGGLMLPESDGYGPCFRRTVKKIRQFDVGFDMKSLIGAEKHISGLKAGSEAEKAGLKNGDLITYGTGLDALQGDVKRTFSLQVTRDGKTFPVTYLPRGEAVDAYQWERVPGVADKDCKL
jgi:hypothetical protein